MEACSDILVLVIYFMFLCLFVGNDAPRIKMNLGLRLTFRLYATKCGIP